LAVVEFRHNRRSDESPSSSSSSLAATSNGGGFSEQDVRTAKVMARHIAIFMNRIVE